jgi:hypothetical protein
MNSLCPARGLEVVTNYSCRRLIKRLQLEMHLELSLRRGEVSCAIMNASLKRSISSRAQSSGSFPEGQVQRTYIVAEHGDVGLLWGDISLLLRPKMRTSEHNLHLLSSRHSPTPKAESAANPFPENKRAVRLRRTHDWLC